MDNLTPPILTADGSHTLYAPQFDEHYHSIHGAIQESRHVFIAAGYRSLPPDLTPIHILEMGFGTGLNAFLTYLESMDNERNIIYQSLEAYPLTLNDALKLNYPDQSNAQVHSPIFAQLHQAAWNKPVNIAPHFSLYKQHADLLQTQLPQNYFNLVYYDAFAPTSQPELWTEAVFAQLYDAMQKKGILVTYCAKGSVKRALKAAGFEVQSLPGPPRKREMTKAIKNE